MWAWKRLCWLVRAPVTEAQAGAARASGSRKHLEKRKSSRLGRPLMAVGGAFRASAGLVGRPGARKGTLWRPTGGCLSPQVGAWAQEAGSGAVSGSKARCRCAGGGVSAKFGRRWGGSGSPGGSLLRGGRVLGKAEAGLATTMAVSRCGEVGLVGLQRPDKARSKATPGR